MISCIQNMRISLPKKMKSNQGLFIPMTFQSHLNFSLILWVLASSEFPQVFRKSCQCQTFSSPCHQSGFSLQSSCRVSHNCSWKEQGKEDELHINMETGFPKPITGMCIASYPCSYRDGKEQIVLGKKHWIKRNGKTG